MVHISAQASLKKKEKMKMLSVGFYQLFKFLATHFGHFRDPTTLAFFYDVISKMTAVERVENGRPL